ncbi:hypothetical protein ACFXKD_12055 [Nocardiopsis aegyptia]|uniref:hypothetical protein n=1 Tax=Nocardiopsis aegyptia TaxID=220378 RepID=UPI0036716A59
MANIEQLAADAGLQGPRRYRVDWERAEAELGTPLPSDYKDYVYWFGPGHIEDFLYIGVPGVEKESGSLVGHLRRLREILDGRRKLEGNISGGFRQPYPLFPEEGGWLPWGITVDGDFLFWVVSSDNPDEWTIAAASRIDDIAHFNGGFAEYLSSYIWDTGEMDFFPQEEGVELPFRFYPLDGSWRGVGERLEPYGYFESS